MSKIILAGDEAFALQQQGKEAWNAWVADNPEAKIDFSGFRFCDVRRPDKILSFEGFKFPNGGVDFSDATFGKGAIGFINATFGDGGVSFRDTTFGDGGVSFFGATFGDGGVYFRGATFGDGGVYFRGATFGDGGVSFIGATFHGSVLFKNISSTKKKSSFDFYGANFKGTVALEGDFRPVPDLRRAKVDYHLDLSKVKISKILHQNEEDDPIDTAARLRRLREISENNRHHDAGLHFFERESQVMRASGEWGCFRSFLDRLYELTSRYGQSILRPFWGLCLLTLVFFLVYEWWAVLEPAFSKLSSFSFLSGRQWREVFLALSDFWGEVKTVHIILAFMFRWLIFVAFPMLVKHCVAGMVRVAEKCEKLMGRKRFCIRLGGLALVFLSITAFFLFLYLVAEAENAFILALSNAIPVILSSKPQATDAFDAIFGSAPSGFGVLLTSAQKLLSFVFLFLIGLGLRNRFRL